MISHKTQVAQKFWVVFLCFVMHQMFSVGEKSGLQAGQFNTRTAGFFMSSQLYLYSTKTQVLHRIRTKGCIIHNKIVVMVKMYCNNTLKLKH